MKNFIASPFFRSKLLRLQKTRIPEKNSSGSPDGSTEIQRCFKNAVVDWAPQGGSMFGADVCQRIRVLFTTNNNKQYIVQNLNFRKARYIDNSKVELLISQRPSVFVIPSIVK